MDLPILAILEQAFKNLHDLHNVILPSDGLSSVYLFSNLNAQGTSEFLNYMSTWGIKSGSIALQHKNNMSKGLVQLQRTSKE